MTRRPFARRVLSKSDTSDDDLRSVVTTQTWGTSRIYKQECEEGRWDMNGMAKIQDEGGDVKNVSEGGTSGESGEARKETRSTPHQFFC